MQINFSKKLDKFVAKIHMLDSDFSEDRQRNTIAEHQEIFDEELRQFYAQINHNASLEEMDTLLQTLFILLKGVDNKKNDQLQGDPNKQKKLSL